MTKLGTGTQTLTGANTYSGKTSVKNGTLSFATGNISETATQALGTNAAVDLGEASTSSGTLNYTGGAGSLAKDINALGNGTIQNSGTGLLTLRSPYQDRHGPDPQRRQQRHQCHRSHRLR